MVRASAPGGIAGIIADSVLGTFPLGTLAGTFHKALFSLVGGDMNQAYDPARATQGTQTHDFGDLKGMASGLFGDLRDAVNKHMGGGTSASGQPTADPHDAESATRLGRPPVNEDARQQAQSKSGLGGWGKALLYGGLALGGLSLVQDFMMGGGFGMPFYGGMSPWMMSPMMPPVMPGMMPGVFW